MNKTQLSKTLKVLIIMTIMLVVMEAIFLIPAVNDFFVNWFNGNSGWLLYLVIWTLMFLQCNIIQLPAVTILELSILSGIEVLSFLYIIVVMSAYMAGCILSYFLGRQFGSKAVKWIAGDEKEFENWTNYMNKKGKIWYFLTILFPIFPDDLLCIVVGSLKFNFGYYCLANLIGRTIGLVSVIIALKYVGHFSNNFPTMLVLFGVALLAEIIAYIVIKVKMKKE